MINYTKGEWRAKGLYILAEVAKDCWQKVTEITARPTQAEEEANAQLIASAPDLYEALKEISEDSFLFGRISRKIRDKWEKALAKAEQVDK